VETDASDLAIAAISSHAFDDGKLYPVSSISRKLSLAEFNYDVFDKEMLAVVFSLKKWRYFLPGAEHKTIVYSDHQNLTYFKTTVSLNRRQARWAEELVSFNFDLYYRKGSANQKADILSWCPAFTSKEGGTTATGNQTLLRKEQWLEVGELQIDDEDYDIIKIGALDIDQLLPGAKDRIKEKDLLDDEYWAICKQLSSGNIIHKHYELKDDILCWKNRVYAPNEMRQRIMRSEHDSKMAEHFGRERTMELVTRNFYWPNMDTELRKYCNECDIYQRTKSPQHAKHGLLHPLEMACKPRSHISTDCITDHPESEGATMILVVVDRFTKMAHFIPFKKKDLPTVARAYLENVWKYH